MYLSSTLNMPISELHWTGMVIFEKILEMRMEGRPEHANYATQIFQDVKNFYSSEAMQLEIF